MTAQHKSPSPFLLPSNLPAVTAALAAAGLISSAHAQIEIAGELFVDIDALAESDGLLQDIPNNGSLGGYFEARGGGLTVPIVAVAGATKGIEFDGTQYMQLVDGIGGALIPPPAGLVGPDATCSVEVWAFNPSIAGEETMVAWGHRGGPDGSNLSFNYGTDGRWGAIGHWGNPDIGWNNAGGAPASRRWHHLVYTYDGTTTRVYADGALANMEVLGAGILNTWPATSINLATQLEADGVTPTVALRGSLFLARVRIHDEVLTDAQIANNYNFEKGAFVDAPQAATLAAPPIHRYSFSEPAGDATGLGISDSIGAADGVVQGAGAQFTGTRLVLPGGASGSAAYGDLPNGLISENSSANLGSGEVSIESWVKVTGGRTWSRVFDIGSSDVGGGVGGEVLGPGGGGNGLDYLMYSAQIAGDVAHHRLELRNEDPAGGGIVTGDADSLNTFNTDLHVVVTWKEATGEIKAFENGQLATALLVDDPISSINDVNVWLGRSNWTADQNMQGEFDEVRFYDRVLSPGEVLGNFQAGPNTINTGESPVSVVESPQDTTVYESYTATFAVSTGGSPPIFYQWFRNGNRIAGATNVNYSIAASLADDGARFSCTVSNFANSMPHVDSSASARLTVLTQAVVPRHRYSFREMAGETVAHDSLGTAHGDLIGGAVFTGNGRLTLNGIDGYVNLPNDLVTGYTSITIEAWVQDDGSAGWARIFDFGNSNLGEDFVPGTGGAAGTQYVFLSAPSGLGNLRGAYTITGGGAGEQIVEWGGQSISVGALHHVVWISHGPMHTGRLFVDGVLVGENSAVTLTPDSLGPTVNDWLGRSQWNDPFFNGQFDEFRISEGAMTPAQVAASFAAGPDAPICGLCLQIQRASGNRVTISWPASASDYFLECTTELGPGAIWTTVPEAPVPDGELLRVTVPADQPAKFYRLSQ
jgi:hypothetical protein